MGTPHPDLEAVTQAAAARPGKSLLSGFSPRAEHPQDVQPRYGSGGDPQERAQSRIELQSHPQSKEEDHNRDHEQQGVNSYLQRLGQHHAYILWDDPKHP